MKNKLINTKKIMREDWYEEFKPGRKICKSLSTMWKDLYEVIEVYLSYYSYSNGSITDWGGCRPQ